MRVVLIITLLMACAASQASAQSVPVSMSDYTCKEFLLGVQFSIEPTDLSTPDKRQVTNFIYAVGFAMGYFQRSFEGVSGRETLVRESMLSEGITGIILGCKSRPDSKFMDIVRPMQLMFGKYSD